MHCQWHEWGPWQACSVSCGSGIQSRERTKLTREALGGTSCPGESIDQKECNIVECDGRYMAISINII